ncbi:MAG TPA: thiamine pyrophosphate-dependent enzyme [Terriglobales bacterium]|jgi:acetolactate synthase-1/2/3 large subunit|nr:thiamine pyrophosphate-dependent enzyme [Terriglobales bacterium]
MAESEETVLGRRNFLKGAVGGVATLVASKTGDALPAPPATAVPPMMSRADEVEEPSEAEVLTTDRPGSDFMVDVLKSLGLEYVAANPGSSFRCLHESVINYGGNRAPELITCCHEESAVGIAHGYAKIEGKPMAVFAHSTVGLQHAAMAIFNAYCDRVPLYVVLGNTIDATMRRPGVEWDHSVQDAAAMVRDYTKWDDLPASLPHFAESAVRAYKIAMTPPMMPVLLVVDSELQEHPLAENAGLRVPKLTLARPPQGDSGAVAEAGKLLVGAENPVIVVDRTARTPAGLTLLVALAETLQAPVVDQAGRMNFPTRHDLNHSGRGRELIANADVILGLELTDFWGVVHSYRDQLHRSSQSIIDRTTKLISITATDLYMKGNYQDSQRFPEVDLAIAADAEATLPSLIEAIKPLLTSDRKRVFEDRRKKLAEAQQVLVEQARVEATYAWDASPISTARLSAELWGQIKDKDWSLVSDVAPGMSNWPLRLWAFDKHYQFIGGAGGYGVGYGAPAAVGAALANRRHGRLSVNIQCDGDLMYAPGVLWTAAHHQIPLLNIMHNNRAYHQEVMHLQRMGNRHNRGVERAHVGTTIDHPNIDFSKLAQSMGLYAEGPITDPKDLGPAIGRAIAAVERGEPALVDVVTQPR